MIKIAVCDDEIAALENLTDQIRIFFKGKGLECTLSKFLDGESLLDSAINKKEHFDVIFLDIKLSQINGIQAARALRGTYSESCTNSDSGTKIDSEPVIVFVTALKEFVYDAFDVGAANYLVKPIETQKLFSTLEKITNKLIPAENKFLILQKNAEVKKIPFPHILYCEVLNHHVFLHEDKNTHEYYGKIEVLARKLDDSFFRCHRSFLVNLNHVDRYTEGIAHLTGGAEIPVASRRKAEFLQALLNFFREEVR